LSTRALRSARRGCGSDGARLGILQPEYLQHMDCDVLKIARSTGRYEKAAELWEASLLAHNHLHSGGGRRA